MTTQIKECIGIIYFTVCLLDGMAYCGFHHTSADDGYFGSGIYLQRAVNTHGEDKFRRIIIDHYCTKEERTDKETKWIAKFDLLNKKIGYNLTKGGEGGDTLSNHPNRDYICEKMSKSHLGEKNYNWGKKETLETCKRKSDAQKGKICPEKTKEKLSKAGSKYVYTFKNTKGELIEILSIRQFCKENNIHHENMYAVKNGKSKSCHGWIFVSKHLINKE